MVFGILLAIATGRVLSLARLKRKSWATNHYHAPDGTPITPVVATDKAVLSQPREY